MLDNGNRLTKLPEPVGCRADLAIQPAGTKCLLVKYNRLLLLAIIKQLLGSLHGSFHGIAAELGVIHQAGYLGLAEPGFHPVQQVPGQPPDPALVFAVQHEFLQQLDRKAGILLSQFTLDDDLVGLTVPVGCHDVWRVHGHK